MSQNFSIGSIML